MLDRIPDERRKEEEKLEPEFEAAKPRLLGALLDGAVSALANIDGLKRDRWPRMADFARFAAAAMPAWGWDPEEFLKAYEHSRARTIADAGRSDAVVDAIVNWLSKAATKHFYGQACALLEILNGVLGPLRDDRAWVKEVHWPTVENQLTRRIRSGAAGLRALGVEFEEDGKTSPRLFKLWWKEAGEPKDWSGVHLTPELLTMVKEDAARIVDL